MIRGSTIPIVSFGVSAIVLALWPTHWSFQQAHIQKIENKRLRLPQINKEGA